jgi:ATP-binding cassette, subfamily C (CFTR/MRP), member 1
LKSAIIRAFGFYIGSAAPLLLVQNIAQLTLPFLLKPLLEFLSPDNNEPQIYGYYYSFGFFIALMVMTFSENQFFNRCIAGGTKLRASFVPTIFRHSLRLSNQVRQECSIGAIVSHMSSDTDKILLSCTSIHQLWSAPLRLLLALYLLIDGLGIAGVVGFICVLLIVPIQTYVMKTVASKTKEVMSKSDARIRVCNEVLSGMRVIKYYAWETPFHEKIEILRKIELDKLLGVASWRAFYSFFTSLNPIAMSCGTFIAYAIIKGNLSPSQAFQALTLFGQMLWPLVLFPNAVASYMDTMLCVDRIESFLLANTVDNTLTIEQANDKGLLDSNRLPLANETGLGTYLRIENGQPIIKIENGTYSWNDKSGSATLIDINLDIKPGSLTAIVGSTGSGKSSLINAMIGEMQMKFGRATMGGTFAYAPQQAWIYNATVKENILFGLDYDEDRYNQAIDAACLRIDIEKQFEAGDETELGEKGINMSGGQRQRLNIARALYAQSDILILDDPLSALDPHVGSDCFENIKSLSNTTRIFACNQLHLTSHFDRIIVIQDGRIIEDGTFDELHSSDGGEFRRLYDTLGAVPEEKIADKKPAAADAAGEVVVEAVPVAKVIEPTVRNRKKSIEVEAIVDKSDQEKKDMGKLVKAETHSVGNVKLKVYMGYLKDIGWPATTAVFLGIIFAQGCQLGTSQWLGIWSTKGQEPGAKSAIYYVTIYVVLSFLQILFTFAANWLGYFGSVIGSRNIHSKFISGLMMSPISFFDSTPMGRITNRMSKDFGVVDNAIMQMLQLVVKAAVGLLGMLIIISINTTYVLVAFVPILLIFSGVQAYYRTTAVQLKRLDAVSRSPIYAHFNECLSGMATIRAYGAQDRMSIINAQRIDSNIKIYNMNMMSNRWLSIRLEFLGGLLILCTALNTVIRRGTIDPAVAGVSLSYALQITTQLNLLVRVSTEIEGMFNAVERIQEFMDLPPEPPHEGPETPSNWPDKGEIDISDLVMSYVPDKPPVLRGLTLNIKPSEKVGVVGRTGAGKSSLFQALFRMMEPTSGKMTFDGIDLTSLGLNTVRNSLSIIPQEPVLFSGTLRFNLDPFEQYTDIELWSALDKASLKKLLITKGQTLDMEILEGGENFSVGQRQLVCLARALLKKSKILVLDEATANVDLETDALIQNTIRENFHDRTTLTIAHRLNTIIDCDKILVLELGRVLEYDSPKNLLLNNNSEFSAMVRDTGPENEASLRATALGDANILAKQRQETNDLAIAAQNKLENGRQINWGPLMEGYRDASHVMRSAWNDHHSNKWDKELDNNGVSQNVWLSKMAELLYQVNSSASAELEKEHLNYQIYGNYGHVYNDDRMNGTEHDLHRH